MILRVPDYYSQFKCLAGKCKDSCCIGWELDIDEETEQYYRTIGGAFGKRLGTSMETQDDGQCHFHLQENGRCPFLNKENLCDICVELGEEALCEVCTEYPRFTVEYGNVYEKSMALSCEEVGRLVFSRTDKIGFTEMAYDFEDAEESEDGAYCIVQIEAIRNFAMELLQNRERAVAERVCEYLSFAQEAQELINLEEEKEGILAEELPELISRYRSRKSRGAGDYFEVSYRAEELGDCFDARMKSLSGMEILDEEWPRTACAMNDFFHAKERSGRYPEFLREFTDSGDYRETEYEQLMVYFTFRYFTKAVYDFNILSKARFAVFGFLTIRDMDCVRFYAQKQCFGLTDQIDTARIFSKEVEHSENNMEYLTEEFVFAEEFQIEKLYHQILIL